MTELSCFAKYAIKLKKCKKIYNIIMTACALICIVYSVSQFFMVILTSKMNLFLTLDCLIFKPAEFVFLFLCCYKHKTVYGYCAAILQFIDAILLFNGKTYFVNKTISHFPINLMILLILIAVAVILTFVNRTYIFLEQQAGFPYFDEKFEDQKFDAVRNNIKNDYQTKMEEYQKNAPEDMAELTHDEIFKIKPEDTSAYNSMDSL